MARIRTIKPELGRHKDLFDLEQKTGLPIRFVWAMFPTICDREGRFRWRPWEIKLDILPYDQIDFDRVMDVLQVEGYIVKYQSDGEEYGYLPTFLKHQVVPHREASSKLPPPDGCTVIAVQLQCSCSENTVVEGEGEGEGEQEQEQEQEGNRKGTGREYKGVGQNTHVASDKPKRPAAKKKDQLSDEEWMQSLTVNPAYGHINVPAEFGKMAAWCQVKGKQPTRSRFLNWLNRIEKPIDAKAADSRYDFLLDMERGKDGSAVSQTRT